MNSSFDIVPSPSSSMVCIIACEHKAPLYPLPMMTMMFLTWMQAWTLSSPMSPASVSCSRLRTSLWTSSTSMLPPPSSSNTLKIQLRRNNKVRIWERNIKHFLKFVFWICEMSAVHCKRELLEIQGSTSVNIENSRKQNWKLFYSWNSPIIPKMQNKYRINAQCQDQTNNKNRWMDHPSVTQFVRIYLSGSKLSNILLLILLFRRRERRGLPEQWVWAEDDIIAEYLQKLLFIYFSFRITVLKIFKLCF